MRSLAGVSRLVTERVTWRPRPASLDSMEQVQSSVGSAPGRNLVTEPRAGILYKLPAQQQNLLLGTVENRRRIFADYESLRKQPGLPPLPQTPHGDEQ